MGAGNTVATTALLQQLRWRPIEQIFGTDSHLGTLSGHRPLAALAQSCRPSPLPAIVELPARAVHNVKPSRLDVVNEFIEASKSTQHQKAVALNHNLWNES